jgi:hypothetical protein
MVTKPLRYRKRAYLFKQSYKLKLSLNFLYITLDSIVELHYNMT